jgi:sterol O-acyltransferase
MPNISTSSEPYDDSLHDHDHVLRPRPRKPVHSQLSTITNLSEVNNGLLQTHENGHASGMTR